MKITDVKIRKMSDEGKMKAIVSVTFDESFVVHDIKLIEGKDGLFIAMPSRKIAENNFKDVAHPIKAELRKELQDSIIEAYNSTKQSMEV